MAKPDSDLTVTPSLIDRLIDREPELAADPYITRAQSVRHIKTAVRRDLEWLLNTRRNPFAAGESLPELAQSLYNYGLPDFSSLSIHSSRDRSQLAAQLERTLQIFEPRLKNVRVNFVETPQGERSRILHFQIEGMLQMDPAPERIAFDTTLQLSSGEYQVRGERGA